MTNIGQERPVVFSSLTAARGLIALISAFYSGLCFLAYANGGGPQYLAMANLMMVMAIAIAPTVVLSRLSTVIAFGLSAANCYVFAVMKREWPAFGVAAITLIIAFGTILIRKSEERHRPRLR